MKPKYVIKRDGKIAPYDFRRIENAIRKALKAGGEREELATKLAKEVEAKIKKESIHVEEIQDLVEDVLMKRLPKIARLYILYRRKRTEERELKKALGVTDDLKLSPNAIKLLKERYLIRDLSGKVIETPKQMFLRVAKAVARAEENQKEWTEKFFSIMKDLRFLPNSPTLMNAGTKLGQLSACFILPVEDDLAGIFETLKQMAIIHKTGGGTGFSFSKLRPAGDVVGSTRGVASGPVSFMRIFDVATEVIKQGGKRRGANMGVLRVDHPDIEKFIRAKEKPGLFENFNLSVAVTDKFMERVEMEDDFWLVNPKDGKKWKKVNSKALFDLIVYNAWRSAEPGLLFIDEINRKNPTPKYPIYATNPCGEVPMPDNESCNLGSINLEKFVVLDWSNKNWKKKVDWEKLKEVIWVAIRFLDDVISVNKFPTKETRDATLRHRRIGLGIMGFANFLYKIGVRYGSKKSFEIAEELISFIAREARKASVALGEEKGSFPGFPESTWADKYESMRNAAVTSIAPTGSISIIADTSPSIEPNFGLVYWKMVLDRAGLYCVNRVFEEVLALNGLKLERDKILAGVPLSEIYPEEIVEVFVTTYDITPEEHVCMQAAFQKHVDLGVSKTVNLPESATPEDVRKIFLMAWKLKVKGITIYRRGSRRDVYTTVCKSCGYEIPMSFEINV